MKDMIVRLLLRGNNSGLDSSLSQSERRLKSFGNTARHEFGTIKNAATSLQGKLAGLGLSFGAAMLIKQSATLDQSITRIGQTAGMSHVQVTGLRKEFFRMSKETGQSLESLQEGFNVAVQSGLKFNEALPVMDAVNKAMAVTGASAKQLTDALTVSAQVFHFDLSKPKTAVELLDKMTVAGRAGNAELENLSSIYSRVAVSAKRAGMNNDQTLAFIETLSLVEKIPERLSTLADSTLRLFTNPQYLLKAQQTTGVKFFDDKKQRRDPFSVLRDIMKKYQTLQNDTERMMFKRRAFQGADLDTQKGLELLFDAEIGALGKTEQIVKDIEKANGQIKKDLADAIRNAEAQANRLKNTLRDAADDFSVVLNRGITAGIKKLLDSKAEGGLDLSGKELIGAGAAALGVGYLGYRLTGGALKKMLGRLGGTGAGIAEGKAIEYATGVTPVFVVNMPGSMSSGPLSPSNPDALKRGEDLFKKKKPGWLTNVLPVISAAGWAVGPPALTALVANQYLEGGGSKEGLGNALRGMPESGYSDDSWMDKYVPRPEVKNDIQINITNDLLNGRVITENNNRNTSIKVNLNRGAWLDDLGKF